MIIRLLALRYKEINNHKIIIHLLYNTVYILHEFNLYCMTSTLSNIFNEAHCIVKTVHCTLYYVQYTVTLYYVQSTVYTMSISYLLLLMELSL